ncbi:MAG: T9SS type A sorting domain-containing protein [Fibrobacteria bacterium]|nr:T9SS type A sorting domain-containing protein [Fibrobacteria bacterium]
MLVHGEWQVTTWSNDSLVLSWSLSHNEQAPGEVSTVIAVPSGAILLPRITVLATKPVLTLPGTIDKTYNGNVVIREYNRGCFRDVELSVISFIPFIKKNETTPQGASLASWQSITQAMVTIKFKPVTASLLKGQRSSYASAATLPTEMYLKQLVANYEQSRLFRTVKTGEALLAKQSLASGNATLPSTRLLVHTITEDIQKISYARLKSAGFPLSDIDPRTLRLFYDDTEVPMYIHGEEDGEWNKDDYIEFIGKRPRGSLVEDNKQSYYSFYTSTAVFSLVWPDNGFGMRAPLIPVPGSEGGVVVSAARSAEEAPPFKVNVHIEKDEEIIRLGGVAFGDVVNLGSSIEAQALSDFWMWERQGVNTDIIDIPFFLPYNPVLDETSNAPELLITIRMMGLTDVLNAQYDHHIKFLLNSTDISDVDGVTNTAKWSGDTPFLWHSLPLTQKALKPGENILTIQKINDLYTTSDELVKVQDSYLDYIELSFLAEYSAVNDKLRFSTNFSDSLGEKQFVIKGLTESDYVLWDDQGRKLTAFNVTAVSGVRQLSFTENVATHTTYLLSAESLIDEPHIILDTLADLVNMANQADYLVITGKSLRGQALDSLISLRTGQGLRCKTIFVEHIYQLFGDGATNPRAIRDFLKYAFHKWRRPAPAYVLLLGETSMWFDKKSGATQKNIVPTNLIQIPGWGVTSNDDYFAKLSGEDNIPDVFIGRIPVASQQALSTVVNKLFRHERVRSSGHWQNKVLLVGGFEKSFTRANQTMQSQLVTDNRQISRLDIEISSNYYRSLQDEPSFYRQVDSAFNIVNFIGHGGGAVWSDAGILTLKELDSLKGDFAVPLITSLTCLTGYFEDVGARSLGEELIRLPRTGAITFYGASGYTSDQAGSIMGQELFSAVAMNGETTAGRIICQTETMMALKTGLSYLPITGEFDLLGDPATSLYFPDAEEKLEITEESHDNQNHNFTVKGDNLKIESGTGVITLFIEDSTVQSKPISFSGSGFSTTFSFSSKNLASDFFYGKMVFHYWDRDVSHSAYVNFSTFDWLIDSIALSPARIGLGDSLQVRFSLEKLTGEYDFLGGTFVYGVFEDKPENFVQGDEIVIAQADDGKFETQNSIVINSQRQDLVSPSLFFQIRLIINHKKGGGSNNLKIESKIYERSLELPSDISFSTLPFTVPIQDSLGVWVKLLNKGLAPDSQFKLAYSFTLSDSLQVTDTLDYARTLNVNQVDSVFILIKDALLNKPFSVSILTSSANNEHNTTNNSADTQFTIRSLFIKNQSDTLKLDSQFVLLPVENFKAGRVFIEENFVTPKIPEHITVVSQKDGGPGYYHVSVPDTATNFNLLYSVKGGLNKKSSTTPQWHYYVEQSENWLKLDQVGNSSDRVSADYFKAGVYAVCLNNDNTAPKIAVTARGQLLLQDDYIPQKVPLDITLRDNTGIDYILHPPEILGSDGLFDTSKVSMVVSNPLARTGALQIRPDERIKRDSIEVLVHDISGNQSRYPFSFRYGSGLKIKVIGSYPNPFADTTVFVYQLTDWADEVSIKIYSRAGRYVQSFREPVESGYKEVVWDGKSSKGEEVANGLYYLKIYAKRGNKKSSKIFKLFKIKRK